MDSIGQHLPQLAPGSRGSGQLALQTLSLNCSPDTAAELTMVILGCYRKGDCDDPEVFVTAAAAVLSRYPEDVARAVTDPHSGIAGKLKWFPTIYEIREACDIENVRRQRIVEREKNREQQFDERDRMAALSSAEKRKEFIAGWRKRMDEHFAKLAVADATIVLADLDPRSLSGEHKRVVQAALDEKLAHLTKHFHATPLTLSEAARAGVGLSGGEA